MAVFLGQCCKSKSDVHTLAVAAPLTKYGHTNAARANSRVRLIVRKTKGRILYVPNVQQSRKREKGERKKERKKETRLSRVLLE